MSNMNYSLTIVSLKTQRRGAETVLKGENRGKQTKLMSHHDT